MKYENKITYSCQKIPAVNKAANLKADKDGYYRVILGGYGCSNASGVYYTATQATRRIFGAGGTLQRRIAGGNLRGEYGHPKTLGKPPHIQAALLRDVDEDRISHHIKKVQLVDVKDAKGRPLTLVYGWVLPAGPQGKYLRESLNNKNENVCFSVRSASKRRLVNGIWHREVWDVWNYDFVNEGGILEASQFDTIHLDEYNDLDTESLTGLDFSKFICEDSNEIEFTETDIEKSLMECAGMDVESAVQSMAQVRTDLGWKNVPILDLSTQCGSLGI